MKIALVEVWAFYFVWRALCAAAFFDRETDLGIKLTVLDERIRFLIIPLLAISAIASLMGYGPFNAATGQLWFSTKILIFAGMLVIGLLLRFIVREWTVPFHALAENSSDKANEDKLG